MDDFVEIDLGRVLRVLLRKWWLIVLLGVLGGGAAYAYTYYLVTPMYQTSISVYVNNARADAIKSETIETADLTASQKLVNTYVTIITSNTVLNEVSTDIGSIYSASQIRAMVACAAVKDTEIFNVTVTNPSPYIAAFIANAFAGIIPAEIPKFLEGSSVKIIDFAVVPASPFTPNYLRNIALGVAAGILFVSLLLVIIDIFDKRIKSEIDLERLSDIPILGAVPDFLNAKKYEQDYGYASGGKEKVAV